MELLFYTIVGLWIIWAWDEPERLGYWLGRVLRAMRTQTRGDAEALRTKSIAAEKRWKKMRKEGHKEAWAGEAWRGWDDD